MAKTINREKKDRSRPWQKAATRSAILSAARGLVERSAAETITLSAIGREAGIAPTTIYAYFTNKTELFAAVVAEDLAQFARSIGEENHDDETQKEAAAEALLSSPAEVPEEDLATAQSSHQDIAKLQEAVARLESRPVDAWLERRLREFERGLTAIESKLNNSNQDGVQLALEQSVRSLTTRLDTVESRLAQATDETMRDIARRLEASEGQTRQAQSDIDAVHARIASRLDALENAAFAAAPAFFQNMSSEETQRAGAVAETIVPATPPTALPDSGVRQDTGSGFLSAARRSAQEAQWRAETEAPSRKNPRRPTRKSLYWIAGSLTILVGLIWTRVFITAHELAALGVSPAARAETFSSSASVLPKPASHVAGKASATSATTDLMIGLSLLDGPRRNDTAAARWLRLSVQQGNALAALKLATLYRDGRGVPADSVEAFRLNRLAAAAHNCDAMYNLAVAYAEGWGTTRDYASAVRWFAQAASQGVTDSQFNLGVMYERGLGVPLSLTDAYKWYLIAAAQGDRQAELRVAALKPELASTDLAAAEEAAAAFKPAPRDRNANEVPAAATRSSAS